MLQKGFLKSRDEKENTRTIKISRIFLFAGIIIILFALMRALFGIINLEGPVQYANTWFAMLIVGFCLVFVSLWMNFFSKKSTHRS